MRKKTSENNIAILIGGVVLMLVGEGVFKWGGWLVVLLWLSDWEGVFWYALILGVVLAGMNGQGLGWISLLLVVLSLAFRFLRQTLMENGLLAVLVLVVSGWLVDKVLGMSWSWLEAVLSGVLWWLIYRWQERESGLSIRR